MDTESIRRRLETTAATAKPSSQYRDGERFNSPVFTVSVGPSQKEYRVHSSVLCTSPVFSRICEGDFKEAHECHISLPEDSAQDFDAIVEYLYMNKFITIGNTVTPDGQHRDRETCALELASLYVTAEKYQMDDLKSLVVEKFKNCTKDCAPAEVLAIADTIYPSIPHTDEVFPSYIRALVIECMELRSEQQQQQHGGSNPKKRKIIATASPPPDDDDITTTTSSSQPDEDTTAVLDAWIEKGGRLAVDISRAYMAHWKKQGVAAIKRIQRKVEIEQDKHEERHSRCIKCVGNHYETRKVVEGALREFEESEVKGKMAEVVDEAILVGKDDD
ncbi:MAG: hypothetical protein Q9207_006519 [Kuettlingeria erythrocarpa]